MSPWVPVAVMVVVALIGVAGHLLVVGRMVGAFTTKQEAQGDALRRLEMATEERFSKMTAAITERHEKIDRRLDEVGDEVADEASRRSGFEQRLAQVEDAAKVMWDVRDKLTAMSAANEVHEQYRREKWDKLEREVAGVSRQLGTIAAKGLEYRPPHTSLG